MTGIANVEAIKRYENPGARYKSGVPLLPFVHPFSFLSHSLFFSLSISYSLSVLPPYIVAISLRPFFHNHTSNHSTLLFVELSASLSTGFVRFSLFTSPSVILAISSAFFPHVLALFS